MKIKSNNLIQKLVVGGVAYTPYNPFNTEVTGTTNNSSTSDNKAEKISGTMTAEIINIVKQNGLPNDVNVFINNVNKFLKESSALSTASLFGGTTDYSLGQLLQIQSMANEVRHNQAIYEKAMANIESEDIGSSLAINTNGQLYVLDKNGKLIQIPINEFDKKAHRLLTNSELLGLRRDPKNYGLAMNDSILSDLQYSKGLKSINEHIRIAATAFGEKTISSGYITKNEESIRKGIEALTGKGPDGYYKYENSVKVEDVNRATSFLYSTLDEEMKNRLKAESVRYGMKPDEFIKNYIQQALVEYNKYDSDVSFDKSATEYDPNGDGKSSTTMVTDTTGEAYSTGQGFAPPVYTMFMTSKSNTPIYALVQNMGPIQTADGTKAFGNANLEDVLTNSAGLPLMGIDKSAITFGDMPIDWIDASKLVYDSSSEIKRVWLPYINDNGKIRPNFKLLKEIDTINKAFTSKKAKMTDSQLEDTATKYGLIYNAETKMFIAPNTMPFVSFGAVASNDTLSSDLENSDWLYTCTNAEDKKWKDLYNDLTEFRSFYADAKDKEKTGRPKTTWWMGYKFFKGNIFIPIVDPNLASRTYNDNYYPRSTYTNTTQKMMAHQQQQYREDAAEEYGIISNF